MPRILLLSVLAVAFLSVVPQAYAQVASTTDIGTTTSTILVSTTTQPAFDQFNPIDVEARVREYFAHAPVMVAIARCESGFSQFASDGNPLYGGTGGMAGVFQIAAAVHNAVAHDLGLNVNTLEGNLAYARYLFEQEGTVPWLASRRCWDPSPLTKELKMGSTDSQVAVLQKILNRKGYTVAQKGEGAPGQESKTFGSLTKVAVKKFQCDFQIMCRGDEKSTGFGMVGKKTRLTLLRVDAKNTSGKLSVNIRK